MKCAVDKIQAGIEELRRRKRASKELHAQCRVPDCGPAGKKGTPCAWTYDIDSDSYDTDCGGKFSLMNDTPLENHMRFCCYCGKRIKEVLS